MKSDIHPSYQQVIATCSCGQKFEIYTTLDKDLQLDICSKCHPFYTGQQKIVDTAGRVERFKAKFERRKPAAKAADKADDKSD